MVDEKQQLVESLSCVLLYLEEYVITKAGYEKPNQERLRSLVHPLFEPVYAMLKDDNLEAICTTTKQLLGKIKGELPV